MPDLPPSLKSTSLTRISEFIAESGSLEQYEALTVWRSLSHSNQAIAEEATRAQKTEQKTANFSGHRNLMDAAAQRRSSFMR